MIRAPPLEVKVAVDAPEAPDGIVKGAIERGAEILLNVAWLKVIEDVGDLKSAQELDAVAAEFEVEGILDLGVEADEGRESTGLVALADVVPIGADVRVGEAGVNIDDGNELKFLGSWMMPQKRTRLGASCGGAVLIGADSG